MARRRDDVARNFGSGLIANDNQARPRAGNALPSAAHAVIEPLPLAVHQAGRARRGQWRVRFAPRWRPMADPLTGWTGGGDPLETIELRFPDRDAAVAYCRREGLRFSVRGQPNDHWPSARRGSNPRPGNGGRQHRKRDAARPVRLAQQSRPSRVQHDGIDFTFLSTSNERTIDAKVTSDSRPCRRSGARRCGNGSGGWE